MLWSWEKGLSVPDADLLIRIADIFEVAVSELLGAKLESEKDINAVAEQLSRINEQLAIKNRRARRIWKTVAVVFAAIVATMILILFLARLFSIEPNPRTATEDNETVFSYSIE